MTKEQALKKAERILWVVDNYCNLDSVENYGDLIEYVAEIILEKEKE